MTTPEDVFVLAYDVDLHVHGQHYDTEPRIDTAALRAHRDREKQREACRAAGVSMPPPLPKPDQGQFPGFEEWARRRLQGVFGVEPVRVAP